MTTFFKRGYIRGIIMSDLPEKLKYYRKKSRLTQQQVADVLNVTRSTYSYYETGKTRPKLFTLQMLARLYNTNVDLLLDDYERNNNEVLSSPNYFEGYKFSDRFNQLSDFEQSVLLRIRLMTIEEKKKLIEYLDKSNLD